MKWAAETQGWDAQTTKNNIFNRYSISQINGSDFDPLSIMLYFFPGSLTTNDEGTQQNLRMSGYDAEYINKMYKRNAPEDAQEFYPKVYGMSLKTALQNSDKGKNRFLNGGLALNWAMILFVLLLGSLIYFNREKIFKLVKGKKGKKKR